MQKGLCGDAPDAEHVVGSRGPGAVEVDLCGGVEAVEDEVDIGAGKQSRRDIKVEPVLPAFVLDPLQLRLVVAVEGVFDLFVGEQIEVNVAGDGGGEPAASASGAGEVI